jgi:TetR/AcrR family transcriptional regulator of autoinduction and epiphytic fitness
MYSKCMKTTKSQQEKTRRLIIRTAVELITAQGYDATTMKQLAREAGIGDATIYKYFPTKERILLEYFELTIADALKQLDATPGLPQFTLHEKLQLLVDGVLESLLPDREFVEIARAIVRKSPFVLMRDDMQSQHLLKERVAALIAEAEESGEIAPCDFKTLIGGLFTDYLFAVIMYWLKDETEEFSNTTQLVDLTLAIVALTLKSGVMNKMSELATFMLRSQMARMMQHGSGLLDMLKTARRTLGGAP